MSIKSTKRQELLIDKCTTKIVSSNHTRGEMYSIQLCVLKFVSDLWQVSGFLWVFVCSTNKTDLHDTAEILLKVVLNTITSPPCIAYIILDIEIKNKY